MSIEYIRKHYNPLAKVGGRVIYRGFGEEEIHGTIVGARDGNLRVRFDGEKRIESCHPTWGIEYVETPKCPNS